MILGGFVLPEPDYVVVTRDSGLVLVLSWGLGRFGRRYELEEVQGYEDREKRGLERK